MTWLNKAKEAEEKRVRTAAEPMALDPLGAEEKSESSEEDDDDQDEFVYDIQVHTCGRNTSEEARFLAR